MLGNITWRDAVILVGLIVGTNVIGGLPAIFFETDTTWIERPWYYPPEILFPIVWTLLFTLMGIALFLVIDCGVSNRDVRIAIFAFALQMALNVAWTPVFFGLQRPDIALLIVVVLWIAIAVTIVLFDRVNRLAAALLVPYLAWVSYATILNYGIFTAW